MYCFTAQSKLWVIFAISNVLYKVRRKKLATFFFPSTNDLSKDAIKQSSWEALRLSADKEKSFLKPRTILRGCLDKG